MMIWILAVWFLYQENATQKVLCDDGAVEYRVKAFYCILIFSVPFIIVACRSQFGDTFSYFQEYRGLSVSDERFSSIVNRRDHSKFFYGMQVLFKKYISEDPVIWYGLISFIQAYCVMKTFRRYSPDVGMSTFLFLATSMVGNWMMNGIRQFLAVAILFSLTPLILKKKWYIVLPVAIFLMGLQPITSRLGWNDPVWWLCGVHQSVLIFILAYFCIQGKAFNWKVWVVALVFAFLAVTGSLDSVLDSSVENTTYTKDIQYAAADTGTSIFRVLVSSIPCIMAFLVKDEINKPETPPVISLAANASVITAVLYLASAFTSGIYVGRLPVYTEMYSLVLLPWLIAHPYRQFGNSFRFGIIGAYLAYFFYQTSICWKGLYVSEILHINVG